MIDRSDVESLALNGSKIKHIKTGNIYCFIFPSKAKIDGKWVSGASYESVDDCAHYWRSNDDFEGFESMDEVE